MKTMFAALALMLAAGVAQADPAEGMWQTQEDDGAYAHVTMAPCGAAFCGQITKTFKDGAEYQSPNLGKQIVIDMVPGGDGSYAGQVWRPSNNKIYTGKMAISGNSMKLSGCVAGGLFCKSQNWTRIK